MLNSPSFADIVGPLWQTFMTSLEVYVRSSIEGTEDSYDGRYDSDGADKSLDSFVIQVVKSMTFDIDRSCMLFQNSDLESSFSGCVKK